LVRCACSIAGRRCPFYGMEVDAQMKEIKCAYNVAGGRCTSLCHGSRENNKFFTTCDDIEECTDEGDNFTKE
jgi:hypothetical protein